VSSWEDALAREDRRQLFSRQPARSLQEVAIAALDHPKYAEAFGRLGARVVTYEEAAADHGRLVGVVQAAPLVEQFPRVEVPRARWENFVALLLLAVDDEPRAVVVPAPTSKRGAGRAEGEVLEHEANRAARIFMRDRHQSPYEVWARYNPKKVLQADNPDLLSKNMVAHLVAALGREWLPWDAARNRLVISGEFRASPDSFVIPRRKPAS
jgi:hypothetical protein